VVLLRCPRVPAIMHEGEPDIFLRYWIWKVIILLLECRSDFNSKKTNKCEILSQSLSTCFVIKLFIRFNIDIIIYLYKLIRDRNQKYSQWSKIYLNLKISNWCIFKCSKFFNTISIQFKHEKKQTLVNTKFVHMSLS
jgi:hypothetical protein